MSRKIPESRKIPDSAPHPWPHPKAVGSLKRAEATVFDMTATPDERAAIARFLDLADLAALRWRGTLTAEGDDGWRLDARLTADLAQTCVATLEPVAARIDESVTRHFVPEGISDGTDLDLDPEGEDDPDPFTDRIDPGVVAIEVLALALDPYPRAEAVGPVDLRATPPGVDELDDAAMKPFAGLAALKARLEDGRED